MSDKVPIPGPLPGHDLPPQPLPADGKPVVQVFWDEPRSVVTVKVNGRPVTAFAAGGFEGHAAIRALEDLLYSLEREKAIAEGWGLSKA